MGTDDMIAEVNRKLRRFSESHRAADFPSADELIAVNRRTMIDRLWDRILKK